MPVTDYRLGFDAYIPGTIATAISSYVVRGKYNNSGVVVGYGRAVVQSSTNGSDAITIPATNAIDFVGIVVRDNHYEDVETADGAAGYPIKKQMNVLVQGDIAVEVEQAVSPGDPVYFRHRASLAVGTPTLTVVGKFRKDADMTEVATVETDTATLIPSARWISSTSGAGVAVLHINLP